MDKTKIVLASGILLLLLASGIASAQSQSALFNVQEYVTNDQVTFDIQANNLSVEHVQAMAEIVSNGIVLQKANFTDNGEISAMVNSAFTLYIFVGGQIVYDQIYPAPSSFSVNAVSPLGIAIFVGLIFGSTLIGSYMAIRFDRKNRKEPAVVPDGMSGIDTGAIDATFSIVKDVAERTKIPQELIVTDDDGIDNTEKLREYAKRAVVNTLLYYRENTRAYFGYTDQEWIDIVKGKKPEPINVNMDKLGGLGDGQ